MNRALILGIAIFFAIVGIALLGGENQAVAGHGCHGCGGCSSRDGSTHTAHSDGDDLVQATWGHRFKDRERNHAPHTGDVIHQGLQTAGMEDRAFH